jgi:formate-dependent nitrite reductase membrane component NrfD
MKTHKFDAISFISGLIFTGFGLMFLIPNTTEDLIDTVVDMGSWAWPLILLGLGLALVVPLFVTAAKGADPELEADQTD